MFKQLITFACLLGLPLVTLSDDVKLVGAGASFPYPLYSKMFSEYHASTNIQINYQPIGSGGGIRQLTNMTVDFGGSDAFLLDAEMTSMPAPVIHIPTTLGAVCMTINVPGLPTLKLTGDIIANIFLGKITTWNDPRIQAVNADAKLPKMKIIVIHRSEGSGTTNIFSDYLSKVSSEWKTKVGVGKSLKWPAGLGAKGNSGVAGMIKQIPGSIGYIEYVYAIQNKLPVCAIQNASGQFIVPSDESTSLAADIELPADTRVSITNTHAPNGYPISGFTWILIYQDQLFRNRSLDQAKATVALLNWMIHDGQRFASDLGYAPLPQSAVKKAEALLKTVTFNKKPLF